MKISELIKELKKIKKDNWDINVEVQYRDWWGCYRWTDKELDMEVYDWILIL